jgi:hypothetical protein
LEVVNRPHDFASAGETFADVQTVSAEIAPGAPTTKEVLIVSPTRSDQAGDCLLPGIAPDLFQRWSSTASINALYVGDMGSQLRP